MDFLVDPPAGYDEDSLRRHDWHAEQLQRLGVADVVAEIFADAVEWHVSETEGRQANLTKGTRAIPGRCHYRAGDGMLNRVALDRGETSADVVIDFVPDVDPGWPDLVEVSAKAASVRVRLRLHMHEIEVLAVALDSAVTGGEGELYFRPER